MSKCKTLWVIILALSLHSCSETENSLKDLFLTSDVTTRTAGDGKYDVLGYGYDITDEYMGENATKLRVLDIEAFVKENPGRFDNPFIGTIEQKIFAGEDANSFLKQLITDTKLNGSVASMGKDTGFLSSTITTGFKSNTKYSYSSKYSFAKAEVLKKQRRYYLNTDIQTLSKYLSDVFLSDLNNYSADKIVEMYGTHVLTNITTGGVYSAYYKSTVIEETDRTEKTKTVSAGAKYNISKIGLDINGEWSKTEISEQNRKNSNWACYVKCLGGTTSGTSFTITPNQGSSITVNLGDWTKSVDDFTSRLVEINWNATLPIYELVSNPIKREEIKNAIIKYIDSKKLNILSTVPLYQYSKGDSFHYNTQLYSLGWNRNGITAYVLKEKSDEYAVPLYQFGNGREFHYNTNSYSSGWRNEGIACYVYRSKVYDELVPLYQFEREDRFHYNINSYSSDWRNGGVTCYVFPLQ